MIVHETYTVSNPRDAGLDSVSFILSRWDSLQDWGGILDDFGPFGFRTGLGNVNFLAEACPSMIGIVIAPLSQKNPVDLGKAFIQYHP